MEDSYVIAEIKKDVEGRSEGGYALFKRKINYKFEFTHSNVSFYIFLYILLEVVIYVSLK